MGGPPSGKLAGQHAPLGTCFNNVRDCIQNVVSQVILAAPTGRKVPLDLFPLDLASQVVSAAPGGREVGLFGFPTGSPSGRSYSAFVA